jgi:hypothetical protein
MSINNYDKFLNEIQTIKTDDIVPPEIKRCLSHVEDKIKDKKTSFSEPFDFKKEKYFNISFNLIVKFEKSNLIDYLANVSDYIVRKSNFQNFDINVNIKDDEINLEYLLAAISHELSHVYDLILIDIDNDISSFTKNPVINKYLFSPYSLLKGDNFRKFILLVYENLTHEITAKVRMSYFFQKYKGTYDNIQLMNFFKESSVYRSLKKLENFDYKKFVDSFDIDDLIFYTNEFITLYKEGNECKNINDLYNFYYNWSIVFKKTSTIAFIEVENVIDELIKDIKPYMEKYYCCRIRKYETIMDYLDDIFKKQIFI